MVPVTAFFAAVLGLILVALSVNVIRGRYRFKVALGDGGESAMNRRIRAQANFVEYVPMALVLMALNEINGHSKILLGVMGVILVIGRICHAYSLTVHEMKPAGKIIFRQVGMASTFTVIIIMALRALF